MSDKPLKINRWEVSNFMRIDSLEVDANGKHVVVSGANTTGKTSAVESIYAALKNVGKEIPNPIRTGADKAMVKLDLGEIVVERRWTEKSMSLIVTGADGSRFHKPQQLLDSLLSVSTLDPVAFERMKPADQVAEILEVVGIKPPVDQVKKVVGDDIPVREGESALDYLERIGGDGGVYYLKRRDLGRVATQKAAAVDEQRKIVASVGGPLSPADKQVSASDLLAKLDALQKKQETRKEAEADLEVAKDRKVQAEKRLADIENESLIVTKQIAELQAKLVELSERAKKGSVVVAGIDRDIEAAEEAFKQAEDPSADVAKTRAELADIEKTNAERARRAQATEQLDRLMGESKRIRDEHKQAEDIVNAVREIRSHLLDGINLGVTGLEIKDGQLQLNGVPFSQASQAQKISVGCSLAMLKKPRIRILRIDDGEHLDQDTKRLVFDMADAHGFEVIMTCVKDSKQLEIEIVEGNHQS